MIRINKIRCSPRFSCIIVQGRLFPRRYEHERVHVNHKETFHRKQPSAGYSVGRLLESRLGMGSTAVDETTISTTRLRAQIPRPRTDRPRIVSGSSGLMYRWSTLFRTGQESEPPFDIGIPIPDDARLSKATIQILCNNTLYKTYRVLH